MMLMILPRPGQVKPGTSLGAGEPRLRGPIEQGDPAITGYMISRKSSGWKPNTYAAPP